MKKRRKKKYVPSMSVGNCRYCKKLIYSDESFVAFADKTYAHYICMKQDDEKRENDTKRIKEKI